MKENSSFFAFNWMRKLSMLFEFICDFYLREVFEFFAEKKMVIIQKFMFADGAIFDQKAFKILIHLPLNLNKS
jgi:hypothetical protein